MSGQLEEKVFCKSWLPVRVGDMVVPLTKVEQLKVGGERRFHDEGDKSRFRLPEFEAPEDYLHRFILMLLN